MGLALFLENSERGSRSTRKSEKREDGVKNVIATKVPGESDDAKWITTQNNNGTESERRRKERVSKMCFTTGVCVGVKGGPAGPRGNLQVCALALQDLAGALQRRCHNCCCFFFTHTHTHTSPQRCTGINTWAWSSALLGFSPCHLEIYLLKKRSEFFALFLPPLHLKIGFSLAVLASNVNEISLQQCHKPRPVNTISH